MYDENHDELRHTADSAEIAVEGEGMGVGEECQPRRSPRDPGGFDCKPAAVAEDELAKLRAENAELRQQVRDLHVVLATGVLAELGKLREENDVLKLKAGAVAETYFGKSKGAGALLEAPYDLFIVFSIKAAEITAYFGFSYIFVPYVSDEYGMDDAEAGYLYGAYGFFCTAVGLVLGFGIDRLGVRRSMIVGCTCSTIYRLICALSSSRQLMWFASVTFAPVGAAFGVPVLALAVRRYSHKDNREFAFSIFYSMLCLGCLLGSLIINLVRDFVGDEGVVLFGYRVTWMRMTVWVATALTSYTMVVSFFIRDIQVLSEFPLKDHEFCRFKPVKVGITDAIKDVVGHSKFWRLAGVTGVFVGVRMTFRHLDATFPKYFIRTYGPNAPFELILAINPIVEMIGTPMMTGLLIQYNVSLKHTFLYGAFLSGVSVFALAIWESYFGAVFFVLLLSLGDTIWSPKLYEFSTMAAAEGKEGMFLAITMAPMYLAALPVGLLSGWALKHWCPKDSTPDQRHSQLMWFVIGLTSFASPLALFFLQHKLIRPEDEELEGKTADGRGSADSPEEGEGEHRRPRRLRHGGGRDSSLELEPGSIELENDAAAGSIDGMVIGRPVLGLPRVKDDKALENIPFKA